MLFSADASLNLRPDKLIVSRLKTLKFSDLTKGMIGFNHTQLETPMAPMIAILLAYRKISLDLPTP